MPWIRKGASELIPWPVWQPFPAIRGTLALLDRNARVIDVGAGGRKITPATLAIDYFWFENTDLRSDIHALALRESSVDCVFCTGTFEHIPSPETALKEFGRVLKPGGIVHLEVPFLYPYHPDPGDYYRWTLEGVRELCRKHGFEEIRSGVHLGPAATLNIVLIQYVSCYLENRILRRFAVMLLSLLLTPHKYMDYFLVKRPGARYLAAGVFFVGRKSGR